MMARIVCLCIVVGLLVLPAFSLDSEGQRIMNFARSLQEQGEYYRAITEYERLKSYYPEGAHLVSADFAIAESYFSGGKIEAGLEQAKRVVERYPSDALAPEAIWLAGSTLFSLKRYDETKPYLEYFLHHYPEHARKHEATAMLSATYLALGEREKAITLDPLMNQHINQLEIPQKDVRTAGVLSALLPGSGQMYAERYMDGTIAFFLNVAFISATAAAIESDNIPLAVIVGFFGVGWYGGNVYNAMNSAQKYNQRAINKASLEYYQKNRTPSLQINFSF
ncbi:tetratricopeptide repeat protein [Chrysiogenes arsenatis]|uniref:tetratricopeptide repeat protein n=1 Tax=Chrysiogenes arsenatis TaxID=309797 RepID=UPI0004818891|nr:tetratricopeptide repeat protein [Chrysiogenes arsenatis]